ncbi:integrase, partial [Streptomyces gilvosporeus]
MTTSPAAENDPYLLPMPGPDSVVVLPQWISAGNTHPNSRYQDLIWSLAPLIDNPGTHLAKILWRNCPAPLRGQLKLAAWTMINGQLRPTYLQVRGTAARARTSPLDVQGTCHEWLRLANWLCKRSITSLAACTEADWRAYASERFDDGVSRGHAEKVYARLADLWAFDQLSARPSGIVRPPWDTEGVDDFLPAANGTGGGENTTEPLDPQVLGPLLVWAIRFVDDLSDDILTAWAERCRLTALATTNKATSTSRAALAEYLLPLARNGAPLPASSSGHRLRLAHTYIAAVTGVSRKQVEGFGRRHGLLTLAAERPGPCPMRTPITGQIDGKPWREHMDFNEASALMRHLGTAAMIICLYLTGMRPQ